MSELNNNRPASGDGTLAQEMKSMVPAQNPAGQSLRSRADRQSPALCFAAEIKDRLEQFCRLVPQDSNPDLTSRFLQEQVRDMIAGLITPKRLLAGTFTSSSIQKVRPPLIDGIIHNPQRGPLLLDQGQFSVANPATCVGVVQFKPTTTNISKFQMRLREIQLTYFYRARPGTVMGVVISDANPEHKSTIHKAGQTFRAYEFKNIKWCPVFILFSRRNGRFEPYLPAIKGLLANIREIV